MLTDEQVVVITTRLKAAARAPWTMTEECADVGATVWADDGDRVATIDGGQAHATHPGDWAQADDNAAFIAHAPDDIEALLTDRAALLELVGLLRADLARLEKRDAALLEIAHAVARAMVIAGHAPQPDYLCPHFEDGKAWPLRTKARAMLGLTWLGERDDGTR